MSNKKEDIKRLLELNGKDPSLTYQEIIKKLGLKITPSGLSRWVSKLKKEGKWKSPSSTVDEGYELLAKKVTDLGTSMSKQEMSVRLGITRHKLSKVLAYIANSNDVVVKSSDKISTTSNNVISITPSNSSSSEIISKGNALSFTTRSGNKNEVVILDVTAKKRVKYIESLVSDTIENKVKSKIKECSITTFKRNKNIKLISVDSQYLYMLGMMNKHVNSTIPFKAGSTIWIEFNLLNLNKTEIDFDKLLVDYNEMYSSSSSNREDRTTNKTTPEQPIEETTKHISRVEKLIDNMKNCPHRAVLTESSVTVYQGLKAHTVNGEQTELFEKCLDSIQNEDWKLLETICMERHVSADIQKVSFEKFGFEIKGGFIKFGSDGGLGSIGIEGLDVLVNRAKDYLSKNDSKGFDKIGKFISKLTMNPDLTVINRIVNFIKFKDIEITGNGDLIVYKMVSSDYKDMHTRTVDNSVGSTVFMRRILVDDNEHNQCSNGLHVCALNYFGAFSSRDSKLVSCVLDPQDIVSIPADYNGSKIRCCKYVVLSDVTERFLSGGIKADKFGEFQ